MAHVAWGKGGEADLLAVEGERVRLRSTIAAAPGSPLEGRVAGAGTAVRVKVARCRREGDAFTIEGRLIDASRLVRAELAALVGAGRGPAA